MDVPTGRDHGLNYIGLAGMNAPSIAANPTINLHLHNN